MYVFTVVKELLCNSYQFRNFIGPYHFYGNKPMKFNCLSTDLPIRHLCVCDLSMLNHWGEGPSYYLKLTWGQAIKESILWPPEITWQNNGNIWNRNNSNSPPSLRTRPFKNWQGGSGGQGGVEVYTVFSMQAYFRLALISILIVFIGNVNCTRIIWVFCFELYIKRER